MKVDEIFGVWRYLAQVEAEKKKLDFICKEILRYNPPPFCAPVEVTGTEEYLDIKEYYTIKL